MLKNTPPRPDVELAADQAPQPPARQPKKARTVTGRARLEKTKTLHELLALAIGDFEKVLGDRRYFIDMGFWHTPMMEDNKCYVCLAGSVVAGTLGYPASKDFDFHQVGKKIEDRLVALNLLRTGSILNAYDTLHSVSCGGDDGYYPVLLLDNKWRYKLIDVSYAHNRRQGRRLLTKLKKMHKDLEKAGI